MREDYVHKLRMRRLDSGRYDVHISIIPMQRSERFDQAIRSRPVDVDRQALFAFLSLELGEQVAKEKLDEAARGDEIIVVLGAQCRVDTLQSTGF